MVSSQKKSKTIHSEAREKINQVNHQCKQGVEKSLILPICHADERTANNYVRVGCNSETKDGRTEKSCSVKTYFLQGLYVPMSVHTAKVKAFLLSNTHKNSIMKNAMTASYTYTYSFKLIEHILPSITAYPI
jgi:hypothetical protein